MLLFPGSYNWHLTREDRENMANIKRLRDAFASLAEKRKQDLKRKDFLDRGDLLSILSQDELFCDDPQMIVDECITFFFAGS